jgi:hypothetical protein
VECANSANLANSGETGTRLVDGVSPPWSNWAQADGGSESWPRGWNLDNLAARPRLCVGDSRERRVAGSNVLGIVGMPNLDN